MTDLFAATPPRIGKANAEFLAHLLEHKAGRITREQLRKRCPDANPRIVQANLKFWGIE